MERNARRSFTSEFKAKVALEAIKERMTIEQICQKFELHPNQVSTWKKAFLNGASVIFDQENQKVSEKDKKDDLVHQLYAQIGELKVANDWLKKKLL